MHIGQVQWTEVLVERVISKLVVDVEEERILNVLRWLCVRNPVEFVYTVTQNDLLGIISTSFPASGFLAGLLTGLLTGLLQGLAVLRDAFVGVLVGVRLVAVLRGEFIHKIKI
jgi:hypothetical protein